MKHELLTLFEHQPVAYAQLGWPADHPALRQIELLNAASKQELLRLGRAHLQATQFVGVWRIGGVTLQVLPKIDAGVEAATGTPAHQRAAATATRNLLHMLAYAHDLAIQEQDTADLLTRRSDWFELLTRLLALNLHRLMARGLARDYVRLEEALPVIRGRWQIARQLAHRPHQRALFDVAYDEFTADTPLNQVFRHVVEMVWPQTTDRTTLRMLLDLRRWLAEVQLRPAVSAAHLNAIAFTRLNAAYRPAFNLARMFLEHTAPHLTVGGQPTFAFTFDMNRLFEGFVAGFLRRFLGRLLPEPWAETRLITQSSDRIRYLAQRQPDGEPVFQLRPDLVFAPPVGPPMLIIDTKYKRLDAGQQRLGIAEGDAYQMLAYAVRLGCPRVLLLYPAVAGQPPVRARFRLNNQPADLLAATVDLSQPLATPTALIRELRLLLAWAAT